MSAEWDARLLIVVKASWPGVSRMVMAMERPLIRRSKGWMMHFPGYFCEVLMLPTRIGRCGIGEDGPRVSSSHDPHVP